MKKEANNELARIVRIPLKTAHAVLNRIRTIRDHSLFAYSAVMLMPKKVKYRKSHKRSSRGLQKATRKTTVAFGSYGIKAMTESWVTARQIEAARRAITRHVKRGGKLWIRIFPDKPATAKGSEVPMGKGKGAVDHYVAVVRPGTVMIEIDGVTRPIAEEAFRLAGHKFPVKTKFVTRENA